ncbi:MAG: HD family hydrolase [Fimbriimonadaceae bacterium]|nr:HD family hydrolase [Alphaproteobacteria bacterium]
MAKPAASTKSEPPRAWQRMLSGRRLDLLDPSPLDVEIRDIAHGLARIARWNGQTVGTHTFSVAQHSLLVEDLCRIYNPDLRSKWCLAALLHDASEYVVGDLISPFKAAIGMDYKALELRLLAAINIRFELPAEIPVTIARQIKRADQTAAYLEATQLAGFDQQEATRYFRRPKGFGSGEYRLPKLTPISTAKAETEFLARFDQLTKEKQS